MRTYGLSGSGMDIDQMVKDLMKARRASFDKVWQQKTQMEWQKKDYNTTYTLSEDFRNSTISDFRKTASLQPKQVTSSDDSILSATANADAANVSYSVVVNQLAEGVKLSSSGEIGGSGTLVSQFGYTAGDTLDLKINGQAVSINVTATTTLYDVVSAINKSDANVKANYDATLDRFYIYSNKTGAEAKVDFTGSSATGQDFILNKLKLGAMTTFGQDARINLDGVDITQATNSFTISGVTYNLKSESATPTNISIQPDIDKTIANVKAFVDSYNTMLGAVTSEMNETKYRDFLPLTDAQKADMKENDIKAWEEKARSGLLRRDPILSDMITNLRSAFSTPISGLTGDYRSASSIGIITGSYIDEDGNITTESSNGGKLYVNEDELRKALTEDPDIVYKIFGSSGDTKETKGVAQRLYDQMYTSINKLKDQSGIPSTTDTNSFLAKRLENYTESLSAMDRRLMTIEERYYRQFDAMEAALNKLNQQNGWLLEQFSSN